MAGIAGVARCSADIGRMVTDMKKFILFLVLLLFPSLCFAATGQIRSVVMMAKAAAAGSCMSGTYTIAWDGSESTGSDYACDGSGTPLDGTITGALDINSTDGEGGGDVVLRADAVNEYISWADSGGAKVNLNGAQTVWVRVYISAAPTGQIKFFNAGYDTSNYISFNVNTSRQTQSFHRTGATNATIYSTNTITVGTWTDVAYAWDRPNQSHAVNIGDTWKEETNELVTEQTGNATYIRSGADGAFSMAAGENIRVTKFAVVNGYKAAKPW